MSLCINSDFNGVTDPDAGAYIAAVEAADGQLLEFGVGKAINNFIVGCKADGIWDAIKASCILAGARTLSGALVPLAGTAPTNFNFVSGDYNRKTGLVGNGSTKYLDSNRNNNADPQNNQHLSVYLTALPLNLNTRNGLIGSGLINNGNSHIATEAPTVLGIHLRSAGGIGASAPATGLIAITRNNGTQVTLRNFLTSTTYSQTSETPQNENVNVFRLAAPNVGNYFYSTQRTAFYSIGESLDLALLDTRVTTMINAFAAAIP